MRVNNNRVLMHPCRLWARFRANDMVKGVVVQSEFLLMMLQPTQTSLALGSLRSIYCQITPMDSGCILETRQPARAVKDGNVLNLVELD